MDACVQTEIVTRRLAHSGVRLLRGVQGPVDRCAWTAGVVADRRKTILSEEWLLVG